MPDHPVAGPLGAVAALALVVVLGLVLHRPVAMIPENALKFVVGVLLCSFETFWVGEGMGFDWPGQDLSLAGLNIGSGSRSRAGAALPVPRRRPGREAGMSWLKSIWSEFIGLFVDDGSFAVAILAWLAVCWLALPRLGLPAALPPVILFAGLALILAGSAVRHAAKRS